jgi:hypothetical protein
MLLRWFLLSYYFPHVLYFYCNVFILLLININILLLLLLREFEGLTAVNSKNAVLYDVTACSVVRMHLRVRSNKLLLSSGRKRFDILKEAVRLSET